MKPLNSLLAACLLFALAFSPVAPAAETTNRALSATGAPWIDKPLSLAEAIDLALQQNGNVLKSKAELEATHGVVMQTRAVALPVLRGVGNYVYDNAVERY